VSPKTTVTTTHGGCGCELPGKTEGSGLSGLLAALALTFGARLRRTAKPRRAFREQAR